MAMPRVTSGTVPSASVFNALAEEVDNLGVACCVRRTSTVSVPLASDQIITWQAVSFDTRGDMWSPAAPNYVRIQVPGTYTLTLQERWGAPGGSANGQRAGKIMVNGTSVFGNSIASDKKAGSTDGEGATLSMTAVARLNVGDLIYSNYWSNHGSGSITGLHQDFGGTFLSVARMAPIAI